DVRSGIAPLEPTDIATGSRIVADEMFARSLIFGRLAHDGGGHEQWHANPAIVADANRRRHLEISDAGVSRAAQRKRLQRLAWRGGRPQAFLQPQQLLKFLKRHSQHRDEIALAVAK